MKDDILCSIGDLLAAIDLKLTMLIEAKKASDEEKVSEIRKSFEQIARVVSARFAGDLPHAIEMLEKKIEIFDMDIKESLKSFSKTLIDYESKLEERIKRETQLLQEQLKSRLDHHQREQAEQLENIANAIGSVGNAVVKLSNSIEEFDKKRLDPVLDRLEEILSRWVEEQKTKGGFFSKRR
jgi:uncharacterized protein YoxC